MSQEAVALLTEIRNHLRSIDAGITALVARQRAAAPKEIASDRDLDGKYGDPVLKFNPRDWHGASCKGRRFSECPPDLLDMVASTFDWFADQADQKGERTNSGKPVSGFKRADAARARGWAKRIRDGRHVQQASAVSTDGNWATDDDNWADEAGGQF